MSDNERIANLTGDAIRMSSDSVIKVIIDTATAAERVAGDLRVEAEQLAAEIHRTTDELVGRINEFVSHCEETSKKIKEVKNNRIGMLADINKINQLTSSLPSRPERATLHNTGSQWPEERDK